MTEQAAAVHSSALTLCESVIKLQVGKTLSKHPEIVSTHTLIRQTPAFFIDTPPHQQHSLQSKALSSRNFDILATISSSVFKRNMRLRTYMLDFLLLKLV